MVKNHHTQENYAHSAEQPTDTEFPGFFQRKVQVEID